ncbi:MAG: hypothetical protein JST39_16170, partial [Bacteroidetes bacterium]|nr:hypothetical protein [Bacteroidota bacterium]
MRFLLLGSSLFLSVLLHAQSTTFHVSEPSGAPVPNATIELEKTGFFVADAHGDLVLTTRRTGQLLCRVSSIGYNSKDTLIGLPAASVSITLQRNNLFLDPVEIRALRAGPRAP